MLVCDLCFGLSDGNSGHKKMHVATDIISCGIG